MTKEPLIALVSSDRGHVTSVHVDKDGIDYLIRTLEKMRKELENDECTHAHYFSEDWGGHELNDPALTIIPDGGTTVHHVKLYGWTDEWRNKHGFKTT